MFAVLLAGVLAQVLGTGAAVIGPPPPPITSLFVSSTGNDSTGTGTALFPWASLQHAAAQIRAGGLNGTATVVVTYSGDLTAANSALALGTADSGSTTFPITYTAAVKTNRLLGATIVTGFANYSGGIYRAAVSGNFYTAYEAGVRLTYARTPNVVHSTDFPEAQEPYLVPAAGDDNQHATMIYKSADFNPSSWVLSDMQVYFYAGVSGGKAWSVDWDPISSANFGTQTFTFAQLTKNAVESAGTGSRYFVQGACAQLDVIGEWCLDRTDALAGSPGGGQHYLYVYCRDGSCSDEIAVPTTQDVITLTGTDAAHPVHDIALDSLTVQYSDAAQWFRYGGEYDHVPTLPPTDYWYTEASNVPQAVHAMVLVQNANHISVTNSHLVDTGLDAVFCYMNCTYMTVNGNWFDHVGYNGFHAEGLHPVFSGAPGANVNNNHTLVNNKFTHWGETAGGGAGVWIANASDIEIGNSEFAGGQRQAIGLEGNGPYPQANFYGKNLFVHNDYITGACQDSGDTGAIDFVENSSVPGGPYNSNTITENVIDRAIAHPAMVDAAPYGIFLDNDTSGQTYTNIDIANTQAATVGLAGSSANHTCVNVNGVACGTFNPSLVDYVNIGVIKSTFRWLSASAFTFSDTFEGGIGNWTQAIGTPVLNTTQAHSATHSVSQAGGVLYRVTEGVHQSVFDLWLFDTSSISTGEALGRVDEETYSSGTFTSWNNTVWRGLGVKTSVDATHYVYRIGAATTATSIARTTGWHHLRWDYSGRTGVIMSIDGTAIMTDAGVKQADVIAFGDFDGLGGTFYWDDVSVQ